MQPRQSYHHGNLREALVEAALDLIEERGPHAFTLAEAARRAGVSAAAPYRHFKGRDDLLEEVARLGYEAFAARVVKAYGDGGPDPLAALARVGRAYFEFALEHPGHYTVMYNGKLEIDESAVLAAESGRAFAVLLQAIAALLDYLPEDQRPPARLVANHIWAMSHGIVEVFARNPKFPGGVGAALDMLNSCVLTYLRGLGLVGPRPQA
ncbi:MAG: TetR/AcrR family transcriptional regulator [Paracoccus sp. (in: a-proteobacteria)]|nr:TetR/AcrR family transcriptional regulator [Paracoccus sp. (in: a-proteobacteria)]